MKKIIVILMVLGLIVGSTLAFAEVDRDVPHKFRAFSSNTYGLQACTIYRITGVATNNNAVFALYDTDGAQGSAGAVPALTNLACEGGEATSGDPLPLYEFGGEGLVLSHGLSVCVSTCTVVLEYN